MNALIETIGRFKHIVSAAMFAVILTGCGGGSSGGGTTATTTTTQTPEEQAISLAASVDDASVTEESLIADLTALFG